MFPTYYTNTGVCMCVAINPLKWHLNVYRRTFLSSVRFPTHCRFSNLKKVWYGFPHDLPALPKFVHMLELPGDLLKIPKLRPHYRRMKEITISGDGTKVSVFSEALRWFQHADKPENHCDFHFSAITRRLEAGTG